uniref:Uncharacterized protein n=1 Tax=Brassica campestris TaxID=3711 RepID=A0A3P5Y0M1_BRACM|nr:unnamed protein product [Brassica rapa]
MTLTGLQNIISISGMTLDADYFEALLRPSSSSGPLMYRLTPLPNPLWPFPEDLIVVRDLLRGEEETDPAWTNFLLAIFPRQRREIGRRRTKGLHLMTVILLQRSFRCPDGVQTSLLVTGVVPVTFSSRIATLTTSSPRFL